MSLAYDMTVSAVIAIISVVIHMMALYLFAPDTALHALASQATLLNGADRADLWYQILVMWVPLGGLLVAAVWPLARAYRRQAATAVQQRRI